MKITRLVLSGYKRLMLNNIRHLELDFQSIYQLILGTNGSGKSSVLYELSPLPGHGNNYVKGGYKEISLSHQGSTYVLRSNFKSGNKHSFKKDGDQELNPGGTGAVQKELVEQEFGITQELHELLIGDNHFTNLSPAKRREWITRLCHVDFTYALGVHQKLKSAARDAQGALKHTKNRITTENNKLLSIGDLEALENRYQILHNELNLLFNERNPNAIDVQRGEQQLEQSLNELESLSRLLIEKCPVVPDGFVFDSIQDVDQELNKAKTDLQVNESLRNRIASEQDDLEQLIKSFKEAGVQDIDAVHQQIGELKKQRDGILNTTEAWQTLSTNPSEAQTSYNEASGQLIQLLSQLKDNPDHAFSKKVVQETSEQQTKDRQQLEKYRNRVSQLENQLEHLMSLKEEQCPDCGHRWVPGRSDRDKTMLESTIAKGQDAITKLEHRVSENDVWLEEAREYGQMFYALRQLVYQYPKLKDLWDSIMEDETLYTKPANLMPRVHAFGHDLEKHVQAENLTQRLVKLEKLLESPTEGNQMNSVVGRLQGLTGQIEDLTRQIGEQQHHIAQLSRYRQHVVKYLEKTETLENRLTSLEELKVSLVEGYRNQHIGEAIHNHQNELAGVQARRTEKLTLEGIIKDLQDDEGALTQDHDILKVLAGELSPVDGLIAEQLTGFIQSFVTHINQVIESIWTYELRVLPCGIDSGDLDYKFPLYVKHAGEDNTAPDIAKGSEAQVEVVNLAFRLVMMVYLGLEDYPVYLDEAGRSFDEQHRTNLLSFIKQLVDSGNYTQLFIISHYAAQFNVFTNAEILVLDSTNVTVPKQHNQHALME